jgi:hypothetical protein
VDVRIGLVYSPRELEVELPDDTDVAALRTEVDRALATGEGVLWLTDRKGASFGVSGSKLTYVQIGAAADKGRIGFG